MTIEDIRRPGAMRRPMPTHRTSAATPPAIILDRPQGRGPRSPGASDASSVAMATAFGDSPAGSTRGSAIRCASHL